LNVLNEISEKIEPHEISMWLELLLHHMQTKVNENESVQTILRNFFEEELRKNFAE
jgi:hypothetical protein